MRRYFLIPTMIVLVVLQIPTAFAATAITGTVTSKKADTVNVEFRPLENAAPAVGDRVDFKTTMKGLEVNAGQGEVTESTSGSARVRITKGRPGLDVTAIIYATGQPGPVDYIYEYEGMVLQFQGKHILYPGIIIKFTSAEIDNNHSKEFWLFKDGNILAHPDPGPMPMSTLLQNHHEAVKQLVEQYKEYGDSTKVVWRDRKINGINTTFHVAQVIIKGHSVGYSQRFIITFPQPPGTPPRGYTYRGRSWDMRFYKNDHYDNKFNPVNSEKHLFKILKTMSVEASKKINKNPFRKSSWEK